MPEKQLRRILSDAYGPRWQTRFQHFDFEPIAAASIGQVHVCRTTEGRELALKIQYPGVARSIDSDVDNLASALRLTRILPGELDFSAILDEAKRQLRDEADYRLEAEHLRRYRSLLADEPDDVVPGVEDALTTESILAMDYLPANADPGQARAFVDLLRMTTEPFRCPGLYDFGATDLAARAREAGLDLVFRKGFLRPPPPQALFIQRKLGGTFLLCARLRARVDLRTLSESILKRVPAADAA
jgi:hypothetical protein